MKVHLDNAPMFGTGPGTFANRLARRLFEFGHEVTGDAKGADVSLVFIERSGAPLAKKVVQRLDGIWFKPNEFKTKNVAIKSLYDTADAIVWQSEFDRNMTTKHWGLPSARLPGQADVIIGNGIELNPVKEFKHFPRLAEMVNQYERIYVCSSNWHPQKRLRANIELFAHLQQRYPNSCLIILGANPDVSCASPHVFYTGHVPPEIYNEIYSAANWMLHLAWADHCPNVVIEALAQGTPVVCSEVGGTKELIGSYGVVLQEEPYDYDLADYDNPPAFDTSQVVDLPDRTELDYSSIADIDINNVAQKYIRLFESLTRK